MYLNLMWRYQILSHLAIWAIGRVQGWRQERNIGKASLYRSSLAVCRVIPCRASPSPLIIVLLIAGVRCDFDDWLTKLLV